MLKKWVVGVLSLCVGSPAVSWAATCTPPAGVSDWSSTAWGGCARGPQADDTVLIGSNVTKIRLNGQSPTAKVILFSVPGSLTDEGAGKGSLTLRSMSALSQSLLISQRGTVDFSYNNSDLTVGGSIVVTDPGNTGSLLKMGGGRLSTGGLTVGLGAAAKSSFQMLPGGTLQLTGTSPTITTGANNTFSLLGTSSQRVKLQAIGGAVTFTGGGVYDLGHIEVMNGVWQNKGATFSVASCVAQPGAIVPREWSCSQSPAYTPVPVSALPMPGSTLGEKVAGLVKELRAQDAASCPLPSGAVTLHRYFKQAGHDHLYTTRTEDQRLAVEHGYIYEGRVGYVLSAQAPDTVPLYRLYLANGVDHFYTTREADRQRAVAEGYKDEGIEGYVYTKQTPCSTPLYRLYNGGLITNHFYTSDPVERYRAAARDGYANEGIEGYVITDFDAVIARRNPVMIVGGTYAAEILYWILEGRLDKDGYVYRFFELPRHGTADINASADKLKEAVDAFLRDTGAPKVHLIAHSQGGIVARTYISRHAGQNTVESMISLASPHKGTNFVDTEIAKLLGCPAALPCSQMKVGSTLLQQINNRPPNDPIYYTNFITNNDIFVTPMLNGTMDQCDKVNALNEKLVCNVHVQQFCPNKTLLEHIGLAFDGAVYSGIQQALGHREINLNCSAG